MDFAGAEVVGKGNHLHVKHGDDSGLLTRFYFNKVHQKVFIKINVPGDSKTEWDYEAKDIDKRRFAKAYEEFKNEEAQFGGQTSLEAWGILGEAQINQYRSFNVYTVEHLASVQDGLIERLGHGSRELVNRARAYIEDQKAQSVVNHLNSEVTKRDVKIDALTTQIQQLQEQFAAMAEPQRKKPGRKPKEQQNDSPQ